MWNTPNTFVERGRQYRREEIAALLFPVAMFLDELSMFPTRNLVCETILEPLESDEMVFALYQVLYALLEADDVPEDGHTGIQEATVAELLTKAHTAVESEMMDDFFVSYSARKAVWQSVEHLVIHGDTPRHGFPSMLEDMGFSQNDPDIYRSEKLTSKVWEELILGECYLFGEFFFDTDWRLDSLMDLPPDTAELVTASMGLDLQVVQGLAHSPSKVELQKAETYLRELVKKGVDEERAENAEWLRESRSFSPDECPF